MTDCPYKNVCDSCIDTFANYSDEFVNILQGYYCHGNQNVCARYYVGKNFGTDNIPKDLKPNQITEAKSML